MPKKQLTIEEKKNNALVPEEEWPYKLPDNWCWVRGSMILRRMESQKPAGEYFQYIDIESVDNSRQEVIAPKLLPVSKAPSRASRKLHIGDTLFSLVRPYLMNIAYIDDSLAKCIASTGFYVCSPNKNMEPRYLYWLMVSPFTVDGLNNYMKGDNSPSIRGSDIENYAFPLPPLPEQQRIVSRIESLFVKLDEAKEKVQNVLDGAENRKAAILHQAFTGKLTAKWRKENKYSSQEFFYKIREYLSEHKKKKVKIKENHQFNLVSKMIPKDWILVNLDSISERITDGEHKTPRRVDSYCGYYLLSARNVHNDTLNLDNVDFIDSIEYEVISTRCNPKKDDILLSCSGSVGRCCVISDDNKYCMVRSVAVISQPSCNSRFIMYMIQSEIVQEQIQNMSKQTAQANLFLGAIASLAIPLPPREEQDYIVDILDDKFAKEKSICESCEASLTTIENMKKAILAKAFRGDLGTNNPAEESAKELLTKCLTTVV